MNIELRDNPNLHIIKRIEKEFKIQLEMCNEETLEEETPTPLPPPLNYLEMQGKNRLKREAAAAAK